MKENQAFNQKPISADLKLIEINRFDIDQFNTLFKKWASESQFENLNHNKSAKEAIKTPVIFLIAPKLEIDSADLALILEVARQQNLIPLGFINNSKVISDYASFTNLALFDPDYLKQSQLKKTAGNLENHKEIEALKQNLEKLKIANQKKDQEKAKLKQKFNQLRLQGKDDSDDLDLDFSLDIISEKLFKKAPKWIEKDISENLNLDQITFISGNVFLPVEINSKENLYIFGSCFGQVTVSSEVGQIYIKKLRARRVKIGPYHIESSQFDADLIDQSVVFYLANNRIEYQVIND